MLRRHPLTLRALCCLRVLRIDQGRIKGNVNEPYPGSGSERKKSVSKKVASAPTMPKLCSIPRTPTLRVLAHYCVIVCCCGAYYIMRVCFTADREFEKSWCATPISQDEIRLILVSARQSLERGSCSRVCGTGPIPDCFRPRLDFFI